jgi:hypothetical protein
MESSGFGGAARDGGRRDEAGAVLILALVYIISISLIVGALADWAMNSLNNTTKFQSASELHFAVSGATNAAIHSIRITPYPTNPTLTNGIGTTPLSYCWQPPTSTPLGTLASQVTMDNYTVAVWCTTNINLAQPSTRTVTFYSCLNTLTSIQCQGNPLLKAVVIFDDYPAGGGALLTAQCNLLTVQCGDGQTLGSWSWG